MDNNKVIETIEKKLSVKVDKVYDITENGKEIIVDVMVGKDDYRKVEMKEMKNQYGPYYKIVSEKKYTRKIVEQTSVQKAEKKASKKLRTKTEQLCGANRADIIGYAEQKIKVLKNGIARFKEIEGAAQNDTVIRFVLLMNSDESRVKEDISVSEIREQFVAR